MATRSQVVLAALVWVSWFDAARAAPCDPLDYVAPAPVALDVETVTATHIVEGRLLRDDASPAEGAEAADGGKPARGARPGKDGAAPKPVPPVATAFGFPLGAEDAEAAIPSVRRILRVAHSDHQKRTLIVSAILPDRFEDYLDCRKEAGYRLTVELPERIASRTEYFVRLHWHPPGTWEGDAALTLATAGATVSEGYYAGETRPKPQEFRIKADTVIVLKVTRTRDSDDSEIVGTVGGEAFRIEVPSRTTLRLAGQLKEGNRVQVSGSESCEPPVAVSCVEAESADTPLLPGSFRWKPTARDKLEHVTAFDAEKARADDELGLCRGMAYKCRRPYGASWAIDRQGTALQLRAVTP